MIKEIKSTIIGTLKQDSRLKSWWESGPINIPFLGDKSLPITFCDLTLSEDKLFVEDADLALKNFLSMTLADRNGISELVHKNSADFLDSVDLDEMDEGVKNIKDPHDIWKFVYPNAIYVSRRTRRDMDIYIRISANCEWEMEHGLQLVFRQGKKITRISNIDGHLTESDAYDTPDEEDELLSKF
jgi:hypothetical protein